MACAHAGLKNQTKFYLTHSLTHNSMSKIAHNHYGIRLYERSTCSRISTLRVIHSTKNTTITANGNVHSASLTAACRPTSSSATASSPSTVLASPRQGYDFFAHLAAPRTSTVSSPCQLTRPQAHPHCPHATSHAVSSVSC